MARINKVLIVFLHFGTPWPYSVCALCQFPRSGTRRGHTLYVRCANFRALAHAAAILCMCVVPLYRIWHTSRQYSVCATYRYSPCGTRRDKKRQKSAGKVAIVAIVVLAVVVVVAVLAVIVVVAELLCRCYCFPARSFANKKLTLSCRIF